MPKGGIESEYIVTEASKLREILSTLELLAARIPEHNGRAMVRLLRVREQIEQEFADREERGLDLRSERTRLDTIDNMLHTRAALVVRGVASEGGLEALRCEFKPPANHWWWFLDQLVAERRRKALTKGLSIGAIVLVVLLGGNWLLDHFFGLSPVEKEARGYVSDAEQALMYGNVEEAIAAYEQAVATMPSLGDVQATLGALYDVTGQTDKATETLAKARALLTDDFAYWLTLARAYASANDLDKALTYADKAVAVREDSAEGYYIRGGVLESRGEKEAAIADYEQAAQLAIDQNQDALYVMARTRLGMLVQQPGALGAPGF